MAIVAPWLQPPDFIGAARAGSEVGLSEAQMHQQAVEHAAELELKRDQLAAEMSQTASENRQRQQEQNAALELRREALKQAGLLGSQRNENQANALTARTELEKARLNKPVFANTGNGLVERDPVTGAWNAVAGTSKPAKEPTVKIAIGKDEGGKSILQAVPASQALTTLQKSGYTHWSEDPHNQAALGFAKSLPATPVTPVSAADELKAPANPPDSALPDTQNPSIYPPPEAPLPKFQKGQRAVQDGVTYEFDGQNWNEVKQ